MAESGRRKARRMRGGQRERWAAGRRRRNLMKRTAGECELRGGKSCSALARRQLKCTRAWRSAGRAVLCVGMLAVATRARSPEAKGQRRGAREWRAAVLGREGRARQELHERAPGCEANAWGQERAAGRRMAERGRSEARCDATRWAAMKCVSEARRREGAAVQCVLM